MEPLFPSLILGSAQCWRCGVETRLGWRRRVEAQLDWRRVGDIVAPRVLETEPDGTDDVVHHLQTPGDRAQLDVERGQLALLLLHHLDEFAGDVADRVRDVAEGFDEVLALFLHKVLTGLAEALLEVRDNTFEVLLRRDG